MTFFAFLISILSLTCIKKFFLKYKGRRKKIGELRYIFSSTFIENFNS